jgi:hypothetical protein
MKMLIDRHPVEQALQEVEQLLSEKGLTISYQYGFIITDKDGRAYKLKNVAGMSSGEALPRFCDEDRLVIED